MVKKSKNLLDLIETSDKAMVVIFELVSKFNIRPEVSGDHFILSSGERKWMKLT